MYNAATSFSPIGSRQPIISTGDLGTCQSFLMEHECVLRNHYYMFRYLDLAALRGVYKYDFEPARHLSQSVP